jgi:hypothetical protein
MQLWFPQTDTGYSIVPAILLGRECQRSRVFPHVAAGGRSERSRVEQQQESAILGVKQLHDNGITAISRLATVTAGRGSEERGGR